MSRRTVCHKIGRRAVSPVQPETYPRRYACRHESRVSGTRNVPSRRLTALVDEPERDRTNPRVSSEGRGDLFDIAAELGIVVEEAHDVSCDSSDAEVPGARYGACHRQQDDVGIIT